MTTEALRHIARMLRNHREYHARTIILKIHRPAGHSEVWDYYLTGKLEQFQEDPLGWVLSLDSDNLQRLIDLSGSY
jgi:hypothetical protein